MEREGYRLRYHSCYVVFLGGVRGGVRGGVEGGVCEGVRGGVVEEE